MRKYGHYSEFHDIINRLQTRHPNRMTTGIVNGFLYIGCDGREIYIYDTDPIPRVRDIELWMGL
jgi:hypothetical protein